LFAIHLTHRSVRVLDFLKALFVAEFGIVVLNAHSVTAKVDVPDFENSICECLYLFFPRLAQ
ncbi:uncharacterized protein EI90DRAFT_3055808, partial [Cantharellus anzutake]|uniref:uncharacterized protein n=1 Tax=Cantharellus anzutake TaxID=1750568 RepID=UPI0019071784